MPKSEEPQVTYKFRATTSILVSQSLEPKLTETLGLVLFLRRPKQLTNVDHLGWHILESSKAKVLPSPADEILWHNAIQ